MADQQDHQPGRIEITATLIQKLRRGDTEAGAMLDSQFRERMHRFCLGYLGSDSEAEDAVQDIFVKVLTAETVPDHFRAWLYRVARNHCLDVIRAKKRRRPRAGLPEHDIYEPLTGNLTRLARREERAEMLELLAQLTRGHREILWLRYTEGLSRADVSEVLELPESVVKSRLFEAARKLRDLAARNQRHGHHHAEDHLRTPAL